MADREPSRHARAFPREVLAGDTLDAARALLGARLVRDASPGDPVEERRVGRIVEVEAYIGEDDRASHARFGPTARNRVMYGPPGFAYVYLIYGIHHCLNVVTEPDAQPAAILIRAVEPLAGIDAMRVARAADATRRGRQARHVPDHRLAAGPGLVCVAFGIDRAQTGLDLCDPASPLRLEPRPVGEPMPLVAEGPRVGIAHAGEPWTSMPWRLWITGNPSVSTTRSRPVS